MKKKTLLALLAAGFLFSGCAAGKLLDDANKGLDKADSTLTQVEETLDKVEKLVTRVEHAGSRIENRGKAIGNRAAQLVTHKRYLVQSGDNLWDICSKAYAGAPQALDGDGGYLWPLVCEQNGITDCNLIKPGQIVRLVKPKDLANIASAELQKHLKTAIEAP